MTQDSLIQDSLIDQRREAVEAARIVVIRNGPYELDGSIALVDYLGVPIAAQAPVRLCRCGKSQTKPFCDNSHLGRGFTDSKDPRRAADKLDIYEGQQAYIYDNRGICAHSGLHRPSQFGISSRPGAFRFTERCETGRFGERGAQMSFRRARHRLRALA